MPALKLSSLFIRLGADGAELTQELKKGRKQVSAWSKEINKVSKRTVDITKGAAVGIAAATAVLTTTFASNAATIDRLDKVARKLGDVEANIQAARFAAELEGIAVSALDTGLQRFVRRMSEAANGTGEARGALQELGLDAKELNRLLPTEALGVVLDALRGVETQADRVRLAFKFFDTEGVDFVRLTGDQIKSARQELDQMGVSIDTLDVQKVVAANDSMARLNAAVGQLGQGLTVKLAEPITVLSNELFEAATQGEQFEDTIDSLVNVTIRGLAGVLDGTGALLRFAGTSPEIIQYGTIGYLLFGKKGAVLLGSAAGLVAKIQPEIERLAQSTVEAAEQQAELREESTGVVDYLANAWNQLNFTFEKSVDNTEALNESIGRAASGNIQSVVTDLEKLDGLEGPKEATGDLVVLGTALDTAADKLRDILQTTSQASSAVREATELVAPVDTSSANDGDASTSDSGVANIDTRIEEAHKVSLERIRGFYAEQESYYDDYVLTAEEKFGEIVQLADNTQSQWTQFAIAGAGDRVKILTSELSGALSQAAQHSRKMFELNKVASYANAVVSGYQAAQSALATQPFFPVGLAMLGVAIAKTAANLQGIRKQKFAASGSVSNSGSSSANISTSAGGSTTAVGSTLADTIQDSANDDDGGSGQTVLLTVIAAPNLTQEQIDQQQNEALERNIRAGRISSDAEIIVNVERERVA